MVIQERKMKELTTLKQLDELLESSGVKLVVIDFFADWCGPCKIMGPKFEELASEFPGVVFAKVNIDRGKELTKHYSITSIPHFKFFKEKKELDNLRGADETLLKQKIVKWQ
ncbi:Peptide-N(4)-(N-acetyl-beta-glucosaminyl)asparagine amidase [Stylophora pistillata]|uniref:Thioredoxin n=2 Tax=Stylophora pistillata TaxID=50429 RepID=A0A2B4SP42_STYPI|nr:Peptide-N(4)-(N-acetyl-beta-glucosaminyl)asparagine amidase [Stylophora pistillata]